jgi:hypothetical protein
MVNNFDQIKSLMSFREDDFYFIQILKRRKDNPGMRKDVSVIDNFFIYSTDDLDKYKERIIEICDTNNARATIRVNVRNAKKVSYQTIKIITDYMISGDFKSVKNAYLSACGQFHSDPNKKWIIDVDQLELLDPICEWVNENNIELFAKIKTKNGFHLIVRPFNPQTFKFEKVDILKDSPTVMYCP